VPASPLRHEQGGYAGRDSGGGLLRHSLMPLDRIAFGWQLIAFNLFSVLFVPVRFHMQGRAGGQTGEQNEIGVGICN
jgi:hypothetical protein